MYLDKIARLVLQTKPLPLFLITLILVTACGTSQVVEPQTQIQAFITPTYLSIPTASIEANSTVDIRYAGGSYVAMNSVTYISIGSSNFEMPIVIVDEETAVGERTFEMSGFSVWDRESGIYFAVTFPKDFETKTYDILQSVRELSGWSGSVDYYKPSAILRLITEPLSAFGEPETAGSPCDQNVIGQITIEQVFPLKGNFQFNCEFSDGQTAAVSGAFSQ